MASSVFFFLYSLTLILSNEMADVWRRWHDPTALTTGLDSSKAENNNKQLMYLYFAYMSCASQNCFMLVKSP